MRVHINSVNQWWEPLGGQNLSNLPCLIRKRCLWQKARRHLLIWWELHQANLALRCAGNSPFQNNLVQEISYKTHAYVNLLFRTGKFIIFQLHYRLPPAATSRYIVCARAPSFLHSKSDTEAHKSDESISSTGMANSRLSSLSCEWQLMIWEFVVGTRTVTTLDDFSASSVKAAGLYPNLPEYTYRE